MMAVMPKGDKLAHRGTAEQLLAGDAFEDETWTGLDLSAADLGNKEFVNCTFNHLKLQKSRWKRARLEDCVFEDCDLTGLDPTLLSLRGATFTRCKLMGIDWTNVSDYPVMTFTECNLSYASFVSLQARKTRFSRCVLLEANFIQADLASAVFEDCQLTGARFETCNLERASFAGCHDLLLDPAHNKVRGASIPLEAAVLLAQSFGLKVGLPSDDPKR